MQVPWWNRQGSPWRKGSITPVHFDRQVIVMLVLILMFWCLNSNAPLLIQNCRLYLRPNTNLRSGGYLRKYANQSLLTVITYDLQLFKKLMKLFPTSIITVIALLPGHHLTFLQSPKSSDPSVVWLGMCIILSKIAHQMWYDHPFSQRNRTTERTTGMGLLGDREVGEGWTKFEKGGLAPRCQLCKETLKMSHPLKTKPPFLASPHF